jgi:starch phosphorylase
VELYNAYMRSVDSLQAVRAEPMAVETALGSGCYLYGVDVPCRRSGRYGFTVRVMPRGDSAITYLPGLIAWA